MNLGLSYRFETASKKATKFLETETVRTTSLSLILVVLYGLLFNFFFWGVLGFEFNVRTVAGFSAAYQLSFEELPVLISKIRQAITGE